MNKFLITQSLLNSYDWIFKKEDGYEDFIKTLNRQPVRQTKQMLDGIQFENMVTAYCENSPLDAQHKWEEGIRQVSDIVKDGCFQIKLSKRMIIENVEFILYGVLDVLKAGTIYDIKFSDTYKLNKYIDSPQHPMYFEICPNATQFIYLVSDGKELYQEKYTPEGIVPIETEIKQFMKYLDEKKLTDTYCQLWQSKY